MTAALTTLHTGIRFYNRAHVLARLSWHDTIRFVSDTEWIPVRVYTHSQLQNKITVVELFRTARVGNWKNP
jgi:hypothetical protein